MRTGRSQGPGLPDSEWLRLMLDEIARRTSEEERAAEERARREGEGSPRDAESGR